MSVREATAADMPQILELLRQGQSMSVHKGVSFSDDRAMGLIHDAVHNPMMCAFVWERDQGVIAGMYLGRIGGWWYSDEPAAFDLAFYIDPSHRGGWGARPLYKAFRAWAISKGAKTIWPGTSSGINAERVARFYQSQRLEKIGDVFFGQLP